MFAKRAALTLKIVFALGVAALCLHWLAAGVDDIAKVGPLYDTERAPSTVLHDHDAACWTSEERPLTKVPTAAIVQFRDGSTIYTTDPVLVDAAFAEALASIGYGDRTSDRLDPIALCL